MDSSNNSETTYVLSVEEILKKERDNALKEVELYKSIVDQVPERIYWIDDSGIILGCNSKMMQRHYGRIQDSPIGKSVYYFEEKMSWPEEYIKKTAEGYKEILETGKSICVEEIDESEAGKFVLLSRKVPLYDQNNKIIGILGISTDITELKNIEKELIKSKEQAESASKAKTEFLENMRHDIRTPLTGIIGLAEMIKQNATNPKDKEYANNLVTSSYTLLDLHNEILDAVKVSSGEIPMLKKKFTVKNVFQSLIDLYKAKASYKNLDLQLEYDKSIPKYLIGDPMRIHRIGLELLSNAVNFTDQGSVKLIVNIIKQEESSLVIKFIVEDTGIGISKEKQNEIFIQFKRLRPSYEGIYKGAGLGLYLSKKFIDDLDGEMYVESEVGKGSKFSCILPLKKSLTDDSVGVDDEIIQKLRWESDITTKSPCKTQTTEKKIGRIHILVVEDHPIAATIVDEMLKKLCCDVDIAPNGEKAIEFVKSNYYDLIFMDIGLPLIDGYETTRIIRQYEKETGKHIPIVALTAHVDEENRQRCINTGMNAVFVKPLIENIAEDILKAFVPSYKCLQIDNFNKDEMQISYLVEGKVIDIAEAKKVLGNKPKFIKHMIDLLKTSLKEDIKNIKKAHKQNDIELLKKLAHKTKGAACYCGAVRLKTIAGYLEDAIYTPNLNIDLIEKLYNQFINEIDAVLEANI